MKHKFFEYEKAPKLFWFRIMGRGLHFKSLKEYPDLYSQRGRGWKFGDLRIQPLGFRGRR